MNQIKGVIIKGVIIEETEKSNGVWWYVLKTKKEKYINLVSFDDYRIMMHYNVTINYLIKESSNPKYKDTNKITNVKYNEIITDIGLIKRLLENIKISKLIVDEIIRKFKKNALNIIINEFDKLGKIEMNSDDHEKLKKFRDDDTIRIYQDFFYEMNVKYDHKWYNEINNHFGSNIDKIKDKPYNLFTECKLPFKIVDQIGVKLRFNNHPERIKCIIDYTFKNMNKNGKLYLSKNELILWCEKQKIIIDAVILGSLITSLKKITIDGKKYYTIMKFYLMEKYIENFCNKLINQKAKIPKNYSREKLVEETSLDPDQMDAVDLIVNNNICIITGSPGTGKTYVIAHTCNQFKNESIIILAPTGTAVEKLKHEINKLYAGNKINVQPKCSTIHSFLASNKKNTKDSTDETIEYNTNKNSDEYCNIFIDEMSMVPLILFYDLINFISKKNTKIRLVLSGDKNQLPSIEGGKIFEDMITYSKIPRKELKKIYRADHKNIIENAILVMEGKDIKPDNRSIIFKESETDENVFDNLWQILSNKAYKIRPCNSCVLIPQRQKGICTDYYNKKLQDYYNKDSEKLCKNKKFEIRKKDKLINKKNDYNKHIFNGSILTAIKYTYNKIVKENNELGNELDDDELYVHKMSNNNKIISKKICHNKDYKENQQYDHKLVCKYHEDETNLKIGDRINYNNKELNNLELAYAMTVHSAQGKGYDTVILILHSTMYPLLLTRKLFYTALTRTKKRCIIIGDKKALEMCKKIDVPRITNLFQNNHTICDMLFFIFDKVSEYINLDEVSCLLNEIGINSNYFLNNFMTEYYKESQKLCNVLIHKSNHCLELFKLLEYNDIMENINEQKNKKN